MRTLALVDKAADLVSEEDLAFENDGGYSEVQRLTAAIQTAVRPLQDPELDYRALMARRFTLDTFGSNVPRVWLGEAIENVRLGLSGYLSPPRLTPWRKGAARADRSFPPYKDYEEAQIDEPYKILDWLGDWMSRYEIDKRRTPRWRLRRFWRRYVLRRPSPYEDP